MKREIITDYPGAELEKQWLEFLTVSNYPSHYTSPGFFKEPHWTNKSAFAVLILDDGKIVAAATGLRMGKQIVSGFAVRPQVCIDERADRREICENLAEAFLELAEAGDGAVERLVLNCPEQMPEFAEFGLKEKRATGGDEVVMLDLSRGTDAVFKKFSQSRRSDLRKSMRENLVQVSPIETEAELAELYKIHVDWSREKQLPADSWEAMQSIFANRDYHRIFVAKHDGKVIAGSYFRFFPRGLVEYSANNSMPEFQHLRPNDLLVWKSIEWACGENFTRYSMGGSHLFLRRFGGETVAGYRYSLDRTFLKKHDRREAVRDFAVKTYQSLPEAARQKIKRIAGRK